MNGYTHTENWACRYYGGCANCPFLDYPFCTFDRKNEGLKDDTWWKSD